jgi:hypothetical protein
MEREYFPKWGIRTWMKNTLDNREMSDKYLSLNLHINSMKEITKQS